MKKIILEKYKLINLGLLLALLALLAYMNTNYENWFKGPEALDFYKYYYAIYNPVFVSVTWLSGILAAFIILPSKLFRIWLFYIAPAFLLLTYFLVKGISVYSTNLLNPTRGQMAENGMFVLAVVTAVYVVGKLIYDWKKNGLKDKFK